MMPPTKYQFRRQQARDQGSGKAGEDQHAAECQRRDDHEQQHPHAAQKKQHQEIEQDFDAKRPACGTNESARADVAPSA
jgi:hypothetical protein